MGVADAVNRLLNELVLTCSRNEEIWDYFHVGVIGYGGDETADRVGTAFGGALSQRDLVKIGEVANNPLRIDERTKKQDDGAGGLVDVKFKLPVWFEPTGMGGTPMCKALKKAHTLLDAWTREQMSSFPPIVINITDGESTDGDPVGAAENLSSLRTNDGSILLFNVHISSTKAPAISFPDSEAVLTDQYAKSLFRMSSSLTQSMQDMAKGLGLSISPSSRGFVFKADMVALVQALNIGTAPAASAEFR